MKHLSIILCALALVFVASCKGGASCGPLSDSQSDFDADCLENDSDNCPLVFNPAQVDIDDDDIGDACDLDVSSSFSLLPDSNVSYPSDDINWELAGFSFSESLDSCESEIIVGCRSTIHTDLFPTGDEPTQWSLHYHNNYLVSDFSDCSAYNEIATAPPALYCVTTWGHTIFQGYVTLNPDFSDALSPCDVMPEHARSLELCEDL